jgi:hypothetical protein
VNGDSTNGDESQVDTPAGGLNTRNWPTAVPWLVSSAGTVMSGWLVGTSALASGRFVPWVEETIRDE